MHIRHLAPPGQGVTFRNQNILRGGGVGGRCVGGGGGGGGGGLEYLVPPLFSFWEKNLTLSLSGMEVCQDDYPLEDGDPRILFSLPRC